MFSDTGRWPAFWGGGIRKGKKEETKQGRDFRQTPGRWLQPGVRGKEKKKKMVCYIAPGPISFNPRISLGQKDLEKSCFVQPCVQRSARAGLGAADVQTCARSCF